MWVDYVVQKPSLNNPVFDESSVSPADGATGVSTNTTLSIDVSDPQGDDIDVDFYDASDDSQIGTTQTVTGGSGTASVSWSLDYNSTYNWYAVATDTSSNSSTSSTFSFSTEYVVTTESASNADETSADTEGNLQNLLGESSADVFFEYRALGNSTWQTTTPQTQSSTGLFSDTITGLDSGTDYEYRAVAEYSSDSYSGDIKTFTTLYTRNQYVGRFQTPSSTGTQTVEMPFEPDVVQFIITNTNTNFDTQNTYNGGSFGFSHGFSDVNSNTHIALCSASGSSSTNGQASESSNSYSINMLVTPSDGAGIIGRIQGYVSGTAPGEFTIQWDSTYQQEQVIYRAFRFGDDENVDIGTFSNPSSTGTQKITTGFQPNFLMVKQTPRLENMTQTIQDSNNNGFMHGWAAKNGDGSTSQSVQTVSMNSNNINHHVYGAYDNRIIHNLWDVDTASASSIAGRVSANISTWDSDGFTLDYTRVNPHEGTNHVSIYMAVNSANRPEVGMGVTPTSASTQNISTNSQTDDIFTAMTPTNPSINQDGSSGDNQSENTHGWVFGGRAHTGSQMSMGYSSNSNSVNDHRSMSSSSDVLKQPHTDENGGLHGTDEADVSNITETGFDLNWSQVVTSSEGTAFDQTVYTYWSLGTILDEPGSVVETNNSGVIQTTDFALTKTEP